MLIGFVESATTPSIQVCHACHNALPATDGIVGNAASCAEHVARPVILTATALL